MGIRFYCPNGHRLNVKEFLAGKRGICPHCEARFRIPETSEIPHGAPKFRPVCGAAAPTAVESVAATQAAATAAVRLAATAVADCPPEANAATPAPVFSPLDEAPEGAWYVRPLSGGEYGPASGEVMRRWIAEGRVSAETSVWREGWPEWQAAGPLFPFLPMQVLADVQPLDAAPLLNASTVADTSTARATEHHGRKRTATPRSKSVAIIVTLGLLVVVLSVALLFVLQGLR